MSKIAFLGLGAMGSRMAAKLLAAGFQTTVWNRSPAAVEALTALGAQAAATPRDAAASADIVFSMVRDDTASEAVWRDPETGALAGLRPQAIGVECSTISLPHARALAENFAAADRAFADAPVAGSRPQADAGQLIFFLGADASDQTRLAPALEAMGGATHHAGPAGAGTAVKLLVNASFGVQLALIAEQIGALAHAGVAPARALEVFNATPVASPAAKGAAAAMLSRAFAPAFPIDLVAKDFGLIAASAAADGAAAPMAAAAERVYREAIDAGYGGDNITGVAQLYDV